jgi:hypothetical protein|tara:strand:- start:267 stop:587 length:321 start_codon:yes stop_codon:yes gene_type:complete
MSNKDFDYDGVFFTMGPISIYQFAEFSKHGLGAIRLFQYIKTKQGLDKRSPWVKVDNVNAYKWFGLTSSTKWRAIVKLEEEKLIEVKRKYGSAVKIKITCPKKKIH